MFYKIMNIYTVRDKKLRRGADVEQVQINGYTINAIVIAGDNGYNRAMPIATIDPIAHIDAVHIKKSRGGVWKAVPKTMANADDVVVVVDDATMQRISLEPFGDFEPFNKNKILHNVVSDSKFKVIMLLHVNEYLHLIYDDDVFVLFVAENGSLIMLTHDEFKAVMTNDV